MVIEPPNFDNSKHIAGRLRLAAKVGAIHPVLDHDGLQVFPMRTNVLGDSLRNGEHSFVPSGTVIEYFRFSGSMDGQNRLTGRIHEQLPVVPMVGVDYVGVDAPD